MTRGLTPDELAQAAYRVVERRIVLWYGADPYEETRTITQQQALRDLMTAARAAGSAEAMARECAWTRIEGTGWSYRRGCNAKTLYDCTRPSFCPSCGGRVHVVD
jgi:membrane protease subunit (stomatin/prohibitin family)